jgi:hypothetical protein
VESEDQLAGKQDTADDIRAKLIDGLKKECSRRIEATRALIRLCRKDDPHTAERLARIDELEDMKDWLDEL